MAISNKQSRNGFNKGNEWLQQGDYKGLSKSDWVYLNKFNREYHRGDFVHTAPVHSKEQYKNDCYNRNNSQYRDLMNGGFKITDSDIDTLGDYQVVEMFDQEKELVVVEERSVVKRPFKSRIRKSGSHCKRGHEYSGTNVYQYKGKRHCRICRAARAKSY